jgi:gliding motility-associated-like protein
MGRLPFILALLMLWSTLDLHSQCNADANATADPALVCGPSGQTTLIGSAIGGNIQNSFWSPGVGLTNPNASVTQAQVNFPITYTYTVRSLTTNNLVVNGDFEAGNTGFSSSLIYQPVGPGLLNDGTYTVTTSPTLISSGLPPCVDHTTGSGNMLIANTSNSPNRQAWCQTINVNPNSDYIFEMWVGTAASFVPADLIVTVNGQQIGSGLSTGSTNCIWSQYSAEWLNPGVGVAVVCVQNTNATVFGPFFALDDISFTEICKDTAQVHLDVLTLNASASPPTQLSCTNPNATLDGSASSSGPNISYQWSTQNGNITGDPNQVTIDIDRPGSYILKVIYDDGNGGYCEKETTVFVVGDPSTPEAIVSPPDTISCGNPTILLDGSNSSQGNQFSYSWTTSNGNIVNGGNTTNPTINKSGEYTFIVNNVLQNCADTLLVEVLGDTTAPVAEIRIPDTLDCQNTSVVLSSVNSAVEYIWISPDSFPIMDSLSRNATVFNPGRYFLIVVDATGLCTDTASIDVFANQNPPNIILQPIPVLNCADSVVFVDASASDQGLNIQYFWTDSTGQFIQDTSLLLAVDSPGVYYLTLMDTTNFCSSYDSASVFEIFSDPIVDAGVGQTYFCSTDSLMLSGQIINSTSDLIIFWNSSNGNLSSGDSSLNPFVNLPGTYYLTGYDTLTKCSFTDSVVILADNNVPAIMIAPVDTLTCSNNVVTIDASGSNFPANSIIQWSSTNGNIISPSNQEQVDVDAAGIYQIILEDPATGCTNSASIEVFIDTIKPIVTLAFPDTLDCSTNQVRLEAIVTGTLNFNAIWQDENGIPIAPFDSLNASVSDTGRYFIIVNDWRNGCITSDSTEVFQNLNNPTIRISTTDSLSCQNDSILLTTSFPGNTADFSFQWQNLQSGILNITSDSLKIGEPGTYVVLITNNQTGCLGTDTIQINSTNDVPRFPVLPYFDITCSDPISNLGLLTFGTNRNLSFQWSTSNGNIISGDTTAFIQTDQPGSYSISVFDLDNACSWDTTIVVANDFAIAPFDLNITDTLDCQTIQVQVDILDQGFPVGTLFELKDLNGAILQTIDTNFFQVSTPGNFILVSIHPQTGCRDTISFQIIEISNLPQFDLSSNDSINCSGAGASINLNLTNPSGNYQFTWQGPAGSNISQTASGAIVDLPGYYLLNVVDLDNGCSDTSGIQIFADTLGPSIEFGFFDSITCAEPIVLVSLSNFDNINQTASWSTQNGNILNILPNGSVEIDQRGNYTIELTDNQTGCSSTRNFFIGLNTTPPVVTITPADSLDCLTTQLQLDATGSSTGTRFAYDWDTPNGNFVSGTSSLSPLIDQPGFYILTITNIFNGCVNSDTVEIAESSNIIRGLNYVLEQPDCNTSTGSISIMPVGGEGPYLYSIDGGQSFSGNPNFSNLNVGTFDIRVEDSNGCEADTSAILLEPTGFSVSLPPSVTLNLGENYILNPILNIDTSMVRSFLWTEPQNLNCNDCYRPTLKAAYDELIQLVVVDTNGCIDSTFIQINVIREYNVFFPSAFSPNGDGINDYFYPQSLNNIVGNVKSLLIFDRWGNLIFENKNFSSNMDQSGWDGTYNGKPMDPNVFVWFAEVEFLDGKIEIYKGDLTLTR